MYCTVLYNAVLCNTVLYCTVLRYLEAHEVTDDHREMGSPWERRLDVLFGD